MKLEVKENNIRLDIYIKNNTTYSRSKVQSLIKNNYVLVNKKYEKDSYKVCENDVIEIIEQEEQVTDICGEKMDIDIMYEDEYLLVINKKSGVVVHPAVGNYSGTLVNGLLYHFNKLSNKNTIRPGIVHRLDKDTSGLMVVAKDDKTHELLADMIKHKKVKRNYLALVWGRLKHDSGTIDAPIGRDVNNRQKYIVTDINSKDSVTHFKVIERYKEATLILCTLETGRTHQIRVHLNYINHPVVNDPIYGNKKIFNKQFGQMLHSQNIKFIHPITKKEINISVDAPSCFYDILNEFK